MSDQSIFVFSVASAVVCAGCLAFWVNRMAMKRDKGLFPVVMISTAAFFTVWNSVTAWMYR